MRKAVKVKDKEIERLKENNVKLEKQSRERDFIHFEKKDNVSDRKYDYKKEITKLKNELEQKDELIKMKDSAMKILRIKLNECVLKDHKGEIERLQLQLKDE